LLDKEKWKKRFAAILSLDSHPGHISAGFAVGVFISFTPFFGLHTPLAILIAFLFRLNKITCVTGAWVNTPITVIPVLGISYKLGRILLGHAPHNIYIKHELSWRYALKLIDRHGAPLLLGTSIIGFFAAVLAYFFCYGLVVRFRQKDEALEEQTREMEEVGEELEQ
jgi:uncharacterized protein (DUF2062 family)